MFIDNCKKKEFEVTKRVATVFLFHNDEFLFMTQEEAEREIQKRLSLSFRRRTTNPVKRAKRQRWVPKKGPGNGEFYGGFGNLN